MSIVKASTLDGSLTVNSGSNIFGDEEAQTLLNIIENERLTGDFVNGTIMEIILVEARDYFDDKKSCEEVAGIIQDRPELYVNELN